MSFSETGGDNFPDLPAGGEPGDAGGEPRDPAELHDAADGGEPDRWGGSSADQVDVPTGFLDEPGEDAGGAHSGREGDPEGDSGTSFDDGQIHIGSMRGNVVRISGGNFSDITIDDSGVTFQPAASGGESATSAAGGSAGAAGAEDAAVPSPEAPAPDATAEDGGGEEDLGDIGDHDRSEGAAAQDGDNAEADAAADEGTGPQAGGAGGNADVPPGGDTGGLAGEPGNEDGGERDYGLQPLAPAEHAAAIERLSRTAAVDAARVENRDQLDETMGNTGTDVDALVRAHALGDPDARYVTYGYGPENTTEFHGQVGDYEADIVCGPTSTVCSLYPLGSGRTEGLRATLPKPGSNYVWTQGGPDSYGNPVGDNPAELQAYAGVVQGMASTIMHSAQPADQRPVTPELPPAAEHGQAARPVELLPDAPEALAGTLGFMQAVSPQTPMGRAEKAAATRAFQHGIERDMLGGLEDVAQPHPWVSRADLQRTHPIPDSSDHLSITETQYTNRPPALWMERWRPTGEGNMQRETFQYSIDDTGTVQRIDQADINRPGMTVAEAEAYEAAHRGPVGLAEIRGLFDLTRRSPTTR